MTALAAPWKAEPIELDPELDLFLWSMAGCATTTPTLSDLVEASGGREAEVAGPLARAIELGLVEAMEDYGPETMFILSVLAAGRMGIRLTPDSRRWYYAGRRQLVRELEPGEGRKYFPRPRPPREEDGYPVLDRADPRQPEPYRVLAALEAAESDAARARYGPDHLPPVRLLYGLMPQWPIPGRPDGRCPACLGARWPLHAYCLACDRAGAETFLPPVSKRTRKQMPKDQSGLRGGV